MDDLSNVDVQGIMDSLSDGVYVCDLERRITYWSKSAERITGWKAEEVVGRRCCDNVLCHIDKDSHRLCGEEYCPLHRAMVTGSASEGALLMYAQKKGGGRVPMLTTVAPIRNSDGQIVGGVETFRDASSTIGDLERAKAIQRLALAHDLPDDPRIRFTTHYVPQGIVGGDYYAIRQIADDQYGLLVADVMGHGIAAALYTMHLSQLWQRNYELLRNPVEFAGRVNNDLARLARMDASFATAVCGLVDLAEGVFRFTSAGGPHVLLVRPDGTFDRLESRGLPLAVMEDAPYEETRTAIRPGDRLLLFSDGVTEIHNAQGEMLDFDGLVGILRKLGYPQRDLDMNALERQLLRYSNRIRLDDDLTIVEVRLEHS